MPIDQDIRNQLTQLHMHRQNVQLFRCQAIAHGGESFAPVTVQRGLMEAYAGIAACKRVLRDWSMAVEDMPNDQPELPASPERLPQTAPTYGFNQSIVATKKSKIIDVSLVGSPESEQQLSAHDQSTIERVQATNLHGTRLRIAAEEESEIADIDLNNSPS